MDSVKTRFGRKAIAAVLRHHRNKAMLRYLEYLKSDARPITKEERHVYRPALGQWWTGKTQAGNKS